MKIDSIIFFCKNKVFSGLKDINFIGIRSISWFQKAKKKKSYLEVFQENFQNFRGTWKKLNYSIKNQIKRMSNHL